MIYFGSLINYIEYVCIINEINSFVIKQYEILILNFELRIIDI
jgi:hypothetical protein